MPYDVYSYGDYYRRPARKSNIFGWTLAIILLSGLAFATWLGSFYIFWQPERPQSYRILKKLHKIEAAKRFELTAAPAGEFLNPTQLFERYSTMGPAELARTNAELARNYIRNFQQVKGLVPYVVGRFTIMQARELTEQDIFTSGMVALAAAVDNGALLIEHVYPADAPALPLMKQTLVTGLEIKLERTHDLSAAIHAERLPDGHLLITVMPLLYGTYTVTKGAGTFSLDPPQDLNLEAGWPLFKAPLRRVAEAKFNQWRAHSAPQTQGVPIPGLPPSGTPPPAENSLVRVEPAAPAETPKVAAAKAPSPPPAQTAKGRAAKNQNPTPAPPAAVAQNQASPAASAAAFLPPTPTPATAAPAAGDALASTAGGATWKTYPAGKMPRGRLITTNDLNEIAEHGLAGERVYLKGQFVVNFSEGNRAVLRPKTRLTDAVLHFGSNAAGARIVVEYPAGYTPPAQGSTVNRDDSRPYEITEVNKQSDGQLNVFVREIMQ
jgi:hypothetical protein